MTSSEPAGHALQIMRARTNVTIPSKSNQPHARGTFGGDLFPIARYAARESDNAVLHCFDKPTAVWDVYRDIHPYLVGNGVIARLRSASNSG